jgi:hypothetical protein
MRREGGGGCGTREASAQTGVKIVVDLLELVDRREGFSVIFDKVNVSLENKRARWRSVRGKDRLYNEAGTTRTSTPCD